MISVREVQSNEKKLINEIVSIHLNTFEGFFLTFMGRGFLNQMYKSYCDYEYAGLLVAEDGNKTLGFLAYSSNFSGLYKYMGESIEILEETLWNTIKVFSGYFFETSEGERFCYSVSGDEILISKSKESITRVDVNLAVEEILELNGVVESLQNMKVPGAGYLYPVFLRFGLIRRKGESDGHLSDMDNIQ